MVTATANNIPVDSDDIIEVGGVYSVDVSALGLDPGEEVVFTASCGTETKSVTYTMD